MSPQPAEDARVRDLLSLLEITRQLAATAELEKLLIAVEESTRRAIGCERAAVFLHDQQTDELYSRLATGVRGIRFPAGRGDQNHELAVGGAGEPLPAWLSERWPAS